MGGRWLRALPQNPGADEGAFAATRVAVDHHQMLADQSSDDLVDHLVPAEKDGPLFHVEGAEAWTGRWQLDVEDGFERLLRRQRHQTRSTSALASTSQLPTSGVQMTWVVSIQSMSSNVSRKRSLGAGRVRPLVRLRAGLNPCRIKKGETDERFAPLVDEGLRPWIFGRPDSRDSDSVIATPLGAQVLRRHEDGQ